MKYLVSAVLLCQIAAISFVRGQGGQHFNLLIGTYSGKDTGTKSIVVYDFNAATGGLSYRSGIGGIENPSFLAASADGRNVYAVSEAGKAGNIRAFTFDAATGMLSFLNSVPSGGRGPCYVSLDRTNQLLFAANYGSGSVLATHIRNNGSLDSNIQAIQHSGSSIANDQRGPHAHSVVRSPDNRYLLSADLGADKIFIYRINPKKDSPLSAARKPFVTVKAGSGPRHITFHPDGRSAYVINELSGSIAVFRYGKGRLKFLQDITMLPAGFSGVIEAADVHVSSDGRFVYGTNREESNELLIYSVEANGTLRYAGRHSTLGKGPRNFALDPTEKFLLIANVNSNDVEVFSRDPETGFVKFTGIRLAIDRPACLKFVGTPR